VSQLGSLLNHARVCRLTRSLLEKFNLLSMATQICPLVDQLFVWPSELRTVH
jgi:hypothetical protein